MRGCRPLTNDEAKRVIAHLDDPRDVALAIMGLRSGLRISELLSLRVSDVSQYGKILDRVLVARKHVKGKRESRSVPIHKEAREALARLIEAYGLGADDCLFKSQMGRNRAISRCQAWRILKEAFQALELTGKLATHSLRKTFAHKVYAVTGCDIVKTQKALGHKSLDSTSHYLDADAALVDDAILATD